MEGLEKAEVSADLKMDPRPRRCSCSLGSTADSWVPWDSHCWLIFPLHKYNGFKTVSSNEKYFIKDLHFKYAKAQYLHYDWLCYSSLAIQTNEIKTVHPIWGVETGGKITYILADFGKSLMRMWEKIRTGGRVNHRWQNLMFLISILTKKPSL